MVKMLVDADAWDWFTDSPQHDPGCSGEYKDHGEWMYPCKCGLRDLIASGVLETAVRVEPAGVYTNPAEVQVAYEDDPQIEDEGWTEMWMETDAET